MPEISINAVLDAISIALNSAFPGSRLYSEETPQNFEPGAFSIVIITASQKRLPNSRYRRRPLFDVIYFPKTGKEECYTVADRLFLLLEVVTTPAGDKLRGTDMTIEIVDDALHFKVQYRHHIITGAAEETMESLTLTQGG